MTIALCVLTNGRDDLLERTLASFDEHVTGNIVRRILHDDTGDPDHLAMLRDTYGRRFHQIVGHSKRLGQDKAIITARRQLRRDRRSIKFRYVFWQEDDFEYQSDVDLDVLARVLDERPYLLQLALKRQPWWQNEVAAGKTFDRFPDDYPEVRSDWGATWCEHTKWFTHNPNLQRASLLDTTYPTGKHHEWRFSRLLAARKGVRFGYWGERDAPPIVEHTGTTRVGTGY